MQDSMSYSVEVVLCTVAHSIGVGQVPGGEAFEGTDQECGTNLRRLRPRVWRKENPGTRTRKTQRMGGPVGAR